MKKSLWIVTHSFIFLVVAVIMFVIGADYAMACSCAEPGSPLDELERSTAVFSGKVIERDESAVVNSSVDPVRVTFQVYELWKGPVLKTITVTTAYSEVSCGYEFKEGKEYLVYAYGTEDDLKVSLCSRTVFLAGANWDLTELGDGELPSAGDTEAPDSTLAIVVLSIAGAVVVVLVIIIIARRWLMHSKAIN